MLTLAAFALEYGEFWLLSEIHQSDQLAKSLAVLKRVSVFKKPSALQKHGKALFEINSLIKVTLQVIECIFELEKLSHLSSKEVPALSSAKHRIPAGVYWAIIAVVASATKINLLTSNNEQVSCP